MSDAQPGVENPGEMNPTVREQRTAESPTVSGIWVLTMLLALLYVMAGVPKIGAFDFIAERFEEVWGYPEWFRMVIGALEFIGGIFLIIPQTAFWAAMLLGVIMLGAMYTHLALGNPLFTPVPAICFLLLMVVAYARRPGFLREEEE